MFGYLNWNIPAPQKPKAGCDTCDLYHESKKFNGWKCVCECHAPASEKPSSNSNSCELDWDSDEEITARYGI